MPRIPSDKPGELYLGASYDLDTSKVSETPTFLHSPDLVTHGVCIGMTGSGKTGLCVGLLEECALSGTPVIIIDPKGDLTNLKLLFPELSASEFRPWINEDNARRKNISPEQLAADEASKWKSGLADWGIDSTRMKKLAEKADTKIFTPGSTAGTPLNILSSFNPPPNAASMDSEILRDEISGAVSALLGLLGNHGASPQDREHILLATILEKRWKNSQNTTLVDLINLIQNPPFNALGALSLDSFFPEDDRRKLAFELNTLVASPSFQTWLEGEPLKIENLLYAADGRPRLSICTISHLDDSERMFFVSILLNQFVTWMRNQSGTSSLRAMLYFDEIFGYLPPHPKNPPSKNLLMTILKQGRAFGTSAMLVTQNPVDLDYKALSNCGLWLLGKLQTEQDKARILDGLQGALGEAGQSTDRATLDNLLGRLGKRVFLLHNIHANKPEIMHSRWAMSYLAGPMTRNQIRQLADREISVLPAQPGVADGKIDTLEEFIGTEADKNAELLNVAPASPQGLSSRYSVLTENQPLRASLYAQASIIFRDRSTSDSLTRNITLILPDTTSPSGLAWENAQVLNVTPKSKSTPPEIARFYPLPKSFTNIDQLKALGQGLTPFLVENYSVEGFECPAWKLESKLGESREKFDLRVEKTAQKEFDDRSAKIRRKAQSVIKKLEQKIAREYDEMERDMAQAETRKNEERVSLISTIGSTLLSILGSKKKSSAVTKIGTAFKRASSKRGITRRAELAVKESQQTIESATAEIESIRQSLETEISSLKSAIETEKSQINTVALKPYKSNIDIKEYGILWQETTR